MITPEKIDEWLREIQERPESAPSILRYIANRLAELTALNEELLVENIELRSGQRAEAYESRIAALEYQLELIRRQAGGELNLTQPGTAPLTEPINLLIYNHHGQVLRLAFDPADLASPGEFAHFSQASQPGDAPLRLLATGEQEELLFVYDSGQTVTLPVASLPLADLHGLAWSQAFNHDLSATQELVDLLPIARLPLYSFAIQASRKGLVKKTETGFFQTFISRNYIGSGIKQKPDQMFGVILCAADDIFVMVSKEGNLFSMPVERLPSILEEVMRLDASDHIVAAFTMGARPGILGVTAQGKLVHRQRSWLEPASSLRSRGQALISKERRLAGVCLAAALPVNEQNIAIALTSDGCLSLHKLGDLLDRGALFPANSQLTVLGFTALESM